jgi:hypothetical protein
MGSAIPSRIDSRIPGIESRWRGIPGGAWVFRRVSVFCVGVAWPGVFELVMSEENIEWVDSGNARPESTPQILRREEPSSG